MKGCVILYVTPIVIPSHILAALALDRRTPEAAPCKEEIANAAKNLHSGFKGEKSLEYHLDFLPEQEFLIFHYLRLPDEYGHFQLDFLLLSVNFFLIVEVKNMYDHMNFDEMGQAYRTRDEEVQVFNNPIEQVNMQHRRLLAWLRKRDFPTIPIEKIVIYSQDKTYLRNIANNPVIAEIVMHKEKLLPKIESFRTQYTAPRFTEKGLIDLSYQLLESHTPEKKII